MSSGNAAERDAYIVIKGLLIGVSVFLGAVVIVTERWMYDWCRKRKYKRRGVLSNGFVNSSRASRNGKSLMTFHTLDVEFIAQNLDKSKTYLVYVHIHMMPKVEYMVDLWDSSHSINVRYIANSDYEMGHAKHKMDYYLIGGREDIGVKTYNSSRSRMKRLCKENLKSFLMFICLLIGHIPFYCMAIDASFVWVGLINWILAVIGGTAYFYVKPKVTWTSEITKIREIQVNAESGTHDAADMQRYRAINGLHLDL